MREQAREACINALIDLPQFQDLKALDRRQWTEGDLTALDVLVDDILQCVRPGVVDFRQLQHFATPRLLGTLAETSLHAPALARALERLAGNASELHLHWSHGGLCERPGVQRMLSEFAGVRTVSLPRGTGAQEKLFGLPASVHTIHLRGNFHGSVPDVVVRGGTQVIAEPEASPRNPHQLSWGAPRQAQVLDADADGKLLGTWRPLGGLILQTAPVVAGAAALTPYQAAKASQYNGKISLPGATGDQMAMCSHIGRCLRKDLFDFYSARRAGRVSGEFPLTEYLDQQAFTARLRRNPPGDDTAVLHTIFDPESLLAIADDRLSAMSPGDFEVHAVISPTHDMVLLLTVDEKIDDSGRPSRQPHARFFDTNSPAVPVDFPADGAGRLHHHSLAAGLGRGRLKHYFGPPGGQMGRLYQLHPKDRAERVQLAASAVTLASPMFRYWAVDQTAKEVVTNERRVELGSATVRAVLEVHGHEGEAQLEQRLRIAPPDWYESYRVEHPGQIPFALPLRLTQGGMGYLMALLSIPDDILGADAKRRLVAQFDIRKSRVEVRQAICALDAGMQRTRDLLAIVGLWPPTLRHTPNFSQALADVVHSPEGVVANLAPALMGEHVARAAALLNCLTDAERKLPPQALRSNIYLALSAYCEACLELAERSSPNIGDLARVVKSHARLQTLTTQPMEALPLWQQAQCPDLPHALQKVAALKLPMPFMQCAADSAAHGAASAATERALVAAIRDAAMPSIRTDERGCVMDVDAALHLLNSRNPNISQDEALVLLMNPGLLRLLAGDFDPTGGKVHTVVLSRTDGLAKALTQQARQQRIDVVAP